jgi:hypothetical protein
MLALIIYSWVPITDSDPTNCGRPQAYDADKQWKGKKVVIVSVPGLWLSFFSERSGQDQDQ